MHKHRKDKMNTTKKEITLMSDEGYSIKVCRLIEGDTNNVWLEYHDQNFFRELPLGDCKTVNDVAQAILDICK